MTDTPAARLRAKAEQDTRGLTHDGGDAGTASWWVRVSYDDLMAVTEPVLPRAGAIMLEMAAATDEAVAREADWNAVVAGTATPEQRAAAINYAAACAGWPPATDAGSTTPSGGADRAALMTAVERNWNAGPDVLVDAILARPSPSPAIVKEAGEVEPADWAVQALRDVDAAYAAHMGDPNDDGYDDSSDARRAAALVIEHAVAAALSASNAAQGQG